MRTLSLLLLLAVTVLTTGCARVYESPSAQAAVAAHAVIAIVPPAVTIQGRKKDDPDKIAAAAAADVFTFQHELYSWMLRRKAQGRFQGVNILSPEVTNARLAKAGYDVNSRTMTPGEMADALGVDAVITSRFNTDKPMSEGVALAMGVVFNNFGTTHRTSVNLSIHDGGDDLIWNYDWTNSGSFASPEALVSGLMRNASRRMPYVAR